MFIQFFGGPLEERIQNYAYKIRCESEYLFITREEIKKHYKFKKLQIP
jgi:hypothetical protein